MIDRRRRDQFAEVLRHFASGLLTNDEYEKRVESIFEGMGPKQHEDLALWAVYDNVWFLYDDMRTHRLIGGHALTPQGRTEVARWIMFLYTDQEYKWPFTRFLSFSSCLFRIATLGLWDLIMGARWARQLATLGDWDVWPFLTSQVYEEARQKPRLLNGAV